MNTHNRTIVQVARFPRQGGHWPNLFRNRINPIRINLHFGAMWVLLILSTLAFNTSADINEPGQCGDSSILIHDVQGSGLVSPINGDVGVILEGVVVGDFQSPAELRGFYLQEEDVDADADPLTSEGVFVFDNGFGTDVNAGDVVRVQGDVGEFFGLTELRNITHLEVCNTGEDLPSSTTMSLPVSAVSDWENVEGMLITIPQTLYVSGNFNQGRFGEVDLSVGGTLDTPTNVTLPGTPALALRDLNNRSRIQLDDGSTVQNPLPSPPYIGEDNTLRTGDTLPGLTGVVNFSFGNYEVHPSQNLIFNRVNARSVVPDVGGAISVAAFNVLNYFTTIDNAGPICGPSSNQGCRGADTSDEFNQQRIKLVKAISKLDADIVGLTELENHSGDVPIADLVAGLNSEVGASSYEFISTSAIGGDAIRNGFIYQPAVITPVGSFALLDSSIDSRFLDTKNRPVLAQSFSENSSNAVFTIVVNHLKSKGSSCDDVGDLNMDDGQGNCNLTRTEAANALIDWLATDPTASGSSDFLIIGDLNAYAMENPITAIKSAGYTDLIEAYVGEGFSDGAYSFNFFSESGYLDHALSSPGMTMNVTGAAFWHINADEPRVLDYNDFNQPSLSNGDEFRSSDHDPVLVGLSFDSDDDGVLDVVDICPNTVIPESVPTKHLGKNRWALIDNDIYFNTTEGANRPAGVSFSIVDTGGCSCEQIIVAAGLGKGHRKFGCSKGVLEDWINQ